MHDVLIIANKGDYSYSLLPYFLKYKKESIIERVAEPFYVGPIEKDIVDGVFSFLYNGINITISFDSNINFTQSGVRECVNRYDAKKYDKVFILREYNSRDLSVKSFNNVEILYFKIDENYHQTKSKVLEFLSEFRIISTASIEFKHPNFYHEPILNLFMFYYSVGFDYLSYTNLNVDKTNLMGMYYIPKYKNARDIMYSELCELFRKNNLEFPLVYDTNASKPQLITNYLQMNVGRWGYNHSAMYSDYISSVCGFMFDTLNHKSTQGPADGKLRYYINEKAVKAIMFSKLNIPFILDSNPYNMQILNDLGFWFLNSEFHTFDKNKSEDELIEETHTSIIKAIEHLIDIYKKNNCDLNNTHAELIKLYESKMQNNYKTFMQYLVEPKDGDKLLNFILYGEGN